MLRYQLNLKADGDGWLVTFPDIPEANTGGDTQEEALEMAQDALETAMDFYFEDKRQVPTPSRIEKDQPFIELPASMSAKILLLNEMLAQKVRAIDLARMLDARPQEIQRLIDLHHASKIDTIAEALKVLGKRLNLTLVRA